ncbi:MAG TPA: SPFH domain-containing protein [Gemmatimonadaceae bacterium]|nr:SPFH domain-containing protein [Gemmatimonadaceae bacterium]
MTSAGFFLVQGTVDRLAALPVGLIAVATAVVLVLGIVMFFVSRYRRCPANAILVVSGRVGGGGSARTYLGGGALVLPVIQEYGYMSLEPIRLNVPLSDALSLENIRIAVPAVFTVAIGTDPEVRQNAAMRLLGLNQDQIEAVAHDIIVGQLRAVIASMKIDEINRDRDAFLHKVQHQLEPELRKIGLVLINVNIQDLKDSAGYLEALGKQAAAAAIQQARGDVAEQEKQGEIRVAIATREKTAGVATADKDRAIALRETQREQAVRLADLDKEQQVAEQTAAFQREAMIRDAEQTKRIAVAAANARAMAGEAESQAMIAQTQADLRMREAEAFRRSEMAKREAEAAVQEAQNRALAKTALAEAERVEAERRAALEAPAKAEKARLIVEAEAAAERVRLAAEAEAKATYLKLEAEARGQYEIMAKRAEGLRQVVEAAGGDPKAAFQLLLLDHIPQLAETTAKAISNIKFDKVVVWEGGNANGEGATAGFIQNLARTMPPMMQVLRDVAGVELPSYLGTMVPEAKVGGNGNGHTPVGTPPGTSLPSARPADVAADETAVARK